MHLDKVTDASLDYASVREKSFVIRQWKLEARSRGSNRVKSLSGYCADGRNEKFHSRVNLAIRFTIYILRIPIAIYEYKYIYCTESCRSRCCPILISICVVKLDKHKKSLLKIRLWTGGNAVLCVGKK